MTAEPARERLPVRPLKRAFDAGLALLLIGFTSPVFLLVFTSMLIESLLRPRARGRFFYREPRISHGRRFMILKFRTVTEGAMAVASEAGGGSFKTVKELEQVEANLTWTGRLLRDYYLDELPQLLNILRGHMSFVGPRPWPPADWKAQRARGVDTKGVVPCGLTGLVQAHKGQGLYDQALDLEYIAEYRRRGAWSLLWYDLCIILHSLKVVREGKGI